MQGMLCGKKENTLFENTSLSQIMCFLFPRKAFLAYEKKNLEMKNFGKKCIYKMQNFTDKEKIFFKNFKCD